MFNTVSVNEQLHPAVLGPPLQVYRQLILITVYGIRFYELATHRDPRRQAATNE